MDKTTTASTEATARTRVKEDAKTAARRRIDAERWKSCIPSKSGSGLGQSFSTRWMHCPIQGGAKIRVIVTLDSFGANFGPIHILGPLANKPSLSSWAQLLRRLTTYLCQNFAQGNNINTTMEDESHRWGDLEWLCLYHHACKVSDIVRTGYYPSAPVLLVVLGMAKPNEEVEVEVRSLMNRMRCPIGQRIIDESDGGQLAGSVRSGVTVVLTDLLYTVVRGSTMDRLSEGLKNLMGYSQTVFVYINDFKGLPPVQFADAVQKCIDLIRVHRDGDNVTVRVWLSFACVMSHDVRRRDVGPTDLADEFIVAGIACLDSVAARPIFVMLNADVRFNSGKLSQTGQLAQRVHEKLKVQGLITSTETGPWRSLWLTGGDHVTYIRRGENKDLVFAAADKILFKQKMLLLCSMDGKEVDAFNLLADMRALYIAINSNILAEVAKPPFIIQSPILTQDPATLVLEFEQKRKEADEARKVRAEKAAFVAPEIIDLQPQEQFCYGPFWRLCDYRNTKMFCIKCRTDEVARMTNTECQ